MNCPVCTETALLMTDRSGIEIDYCPGCRGVWLDRGELDKIIERSMGDRPAVATPADTRSTREPAIERRDRETFETRARPAERDGWDDDDIGRDGRPRRRKSLLGELFDF